jgi:hypothetical protein
VIGLSVKASVVANKLTAELKKASKNNGKGDRTTEGLANLAQALSKLGLGCAVVIILYSVSTMQIAPAQAETATQLGEVALCLLNEAVANMPGVLKKHASCNATFAALGVQPGEEVRPENFQYESRPAPWALGVSFLCPAAVHLLYAIFYL